MLKIHQPYIKRKVRMAFAFASIGVLLLGLGIIIASPATHPSSQVYAAGDSRTIHDISNMQEMTQQICSNTDEGDTATLTDNRDGKTYTIVKHTKDKNCWMQQNLRLSGSKTLTPSDSNVTSNWTLPATQAYSTSGTWTSINTAVMSRAGSGTNGNYYTWCAATASTCSSATSDGQVAPSSICPKGWHLPTNGELCNLTNGLNMSSITASPYLFPAAGVVVYDGSLVNVNSDAFYWSSTASNRADAYVLNFHSGGFYPGVNGGGRNYGYSVRCVAPGGLDKIEKPTWSESKDGNVTVTMPSIISIDATSGMDETVDSTKITEGLATATITSNTEYAVTLHSTQPSLKDITEGTTNTAEISPVSASNPVQPGHNSWGFWDGTGDSSNKSYTLPITTTPQNLYNSTETVTNTEGNPATKHTYYVGISISPALPSGTYATDVIITASVK